jgi:hypothetical protein
LLDVVATAFAFPLALSVEDSQVFVVVLAANPFWLCAAHTSMCSSAHPTLQVASFLAPFPPLLQGLDKTMPTIDSNHLAGMLLRFSFHFRPFSPMCVFLAGLMISKASPEQKTHLFLPPRGFFFYAQI